MKLLLSAICIVAISVSFAAAQGQVTKENVAGTVGIVTNIRFRGISGCRKCSNRLTHSRLPSCLP